MPEAKGVSIEEAAKKFVMKHRPSSIIQRAATVEEVANLVVYVASPLSSATTGAALESMAASSRRLREARTIA